MAFCAKLLFKQKHWQHIWNKKSDSTAHTTLKVDFTYWIPPPWTHGLWGLLWTIYGAFGMNRSPFGSPHRGDAKSSQVTPMWSRSQAKTCSARCAHGKLFSERPWDSTGNFRPIHTVDGPAKSFTRWYSRWFIQLFKGVLNIQGGAGFWNHPQYQYISSIYDLYHGDIMR